MFQLWFFRHDFFGAVSEPEKIILFDLKNPLDRLRKHVFDDTQFQTKVLKNKWINDKFGHADKAESTVRQKNPLTTATCCYKKKLVYLALTDIRKGQNASDVRYY